MMNCSDVQPGLSQNNVACISLKCRHYQQPDVGRAILKKNHVFARVVGTVIFKQLQYLD